MARPTDITLYQYATCPYCAKVRMALAELNLDHRIVEVEYGDAEVLGPLGSETVPVIQDGDMTMNESGDIIAYLHQTYGTAA